MKYMDRSLAPIDSAAQWLNATSNVGRSNTGVYRYGLGYIPVGTITGVVTDFFSSVLGSDTAQYDPVLEQTWNLIHQSTASLNEAHDAGTLTRSQWTQGVSALRNIPNQFEQLAMPYEPSGDIGRVQRDANDMRRDIERWVADRADWSFSTSTGSVPYDGGPAPSQAGFGGGGMLPLVLLGLGSVLLLSGNRKLF